MKTDKELVLDFKNGNAVAFDDLVDRYRQPLFSYLGADSQTQDIIQETFQKVHEKIGQFNDTSPFKAWIYRIARNCQIDASRKERRRLDKLNDYISTFQEKADTAPSEKAPLGAFQAVRHKFRRIHIHDGSERNKFFGHFPSRCLKQGIGTLPQFW